MRDSQSWKPILYLGITFGGVMLVMGLAYLVVLLAYPKGIVSRGDRGTVRLIYLVGGAIALGTGMAINHLLKRYFRHYFGSYLDDPDTPEDE